MRILLAGATGQVGSELRRSLALLGEVVAPTRSELDLAAGSSISAAVRATQPELIVNAAAYTAVDRAESEPEIAMAVNATGPRLLAEEAARSGAALIHFSTDYVFDGRKRAAYREDDVPAPLNAYGASKLAGERGVLASTCPHLVFRTGWIYGMQGSNFLTALLAQVQAGKVPQVVDDQFGAPTPAAWVAVATARIVGALCPGGRMDADRIRASGGVYHMTAGGGTSWHGFAVEIVRLLGMGAEVRPISSASRGAAAARPAYSVLDNGKLRAAFGEIPPDWNAALRACLEGRGALAIPASGQR